MTQEALRELYCEKLKKIKQVYVAEQTGINSSVLSKFKKGKIDLYPHLFVKLETFLYNESN